MKVVFATGDLWDNPTGGRLRDMATYAALGAHADVTLVSFPLWSLPARAADGRHVRVYPSLLPSGLWSRAALRLRATLSRRLIFQEHLARTGAFDRLAELLRETAPDVLVASFPIYDGFLPVARPLVPRLIVDLWELRAPAAVQRLRTGAGWGRRARAALDLLVVKSLERDAARYADEVWFVEQQDAGRYAARYGTAVRVVPNTVEVARYARYRHMRPRPSTMAFVGLLDYDPNISAVSRLLERILPRIRRDVPDASLVVVGRRPAASLRALVERTHGAVLREDAPDAMSELASAGPLVAPLESGTGTRLKFIEAAASGVPIVTTRFALSGLDFVPGEEILVADEDEEFADAVVRLWNDPRLAARITQRAYDRVCRTYDSSVLVDVVGRALRGDPEPFEGRHPQ